MSDFFSIVMSVSLLFSLVTVLRLYCAYCRMRAERDSWRRHALQLAARFQPMPRMHVEWWDGVPVVVPDGVSLDDCEEITQEEIEI